MYILSPEFPPDEMYILSPEFPPWYCVPEFPMVVEMDKAIYSNNIVHIYIQARGFKFFG